MIHEFLLLLYTKHKNQRSLGFIQGVPGGKVNILVGDSIGHSKQKKLYMNMCPIPNGFRDRDI
jgi:hypothetical protein